MPLPPPDLTPDTKMGKEAEHMERGIPSGGDLLTQTQILLSGHRTGGPEQPLVKD